MPDDRRALTEGSEADGAKKHRRRRKKSLWRRFRHTFYEKAWLLPACLIAIAVVIVSVLWMRGNIKNMSAQKVTTTRHAAPVVSYRNIQYKGRKYRYNNRITAVLYVGVDSEGVMEVNETFRHAPNADSISLVVMDGYNKKMTIISLNRNTMCKIHHYRRNGEDEGVFKDHLCLAYSYGENGEVSSTNLCNAVSDILYGVPVKDFVITNRSSLPELVDVVGEVSVVVPNDDLAEDGYHKGDTILVGKDNIERYVRSRNMRGLYGNIGRMERQESYINATVDQLMKMIKESPTGVWKRIEQAEYCMRTNITRSRYIDLTNLLAKMSYSEQNYYIPEGQSVRNGRYAEFHPDEEKLLEKVIEIFYLPA